MKRYVNIIITSLVFAISIQAAVDPTNTEEFKKCKALAESGSVKHQKMIAQNYLRLYEEYGLDEYFENGKLWVLKWAESIGQNPDEILRDIYQKKKKIDERFLPIETIEQKARSGDVEAMFNAAKRYSLQYLASEKQDEEALDLCRAWAEKAATAGSIVAADYLGLNYYEGNNGFQIDKKKAEYWFDYGCRLRGEPEIAIAEKAATEADSSDNGNGSNSGGSVSRIEHLASGVRNQLNRSNSLGAYNILSNFVRNHNLTGDECMRCFALSSDIAQGFSGQFMAVTMDFSINLAQKNMLMQNINSAISANSNLSQQLLKNAAQQGNKEAISILTAMGLEVAASASSPSSSSSSSSQKSQKSLSGSASFDVTLLHSDQNTYWNWASMIRDMRLGFSTFNAQKLREYQSHMKELRRRWQGQSMEITYSDEEDWRP